MRLEKDVVAGSEWARRVKLQQLRAVLAVAESASLVDAGERLGLSQPAISKIVTEVEKGLGVKLFERSSSGTHPTELGSLLASNTKRLFSLLEHIEQEIVETQEGISGHVMVGTLLSGSARLLPGAITRLHKRLPSIRVSVIESTYEHLIPALHRGHLDFIVGRLPGYRYRPGVDVESFYKEDLCCVVRCGHPALGPSKLKLGDSLAWPWILPLPDTSLRQVIEMTFLEHDLPLPETICESVSMIGNRAIVLETDCIAVFPTRVVQPDIDSGLLARLPVAEMPFGPVGISYLKGASFSKACRALLDDLRRAAQEA